jgi:N-6 DNA Methylase
MGEPSDKAKDILGRIYEYFLGGFAGSDGKRGGEFYTPRSVVRVLVEMLESYKGRGSRRSLSIAPPEAGRGIDCPARGAKDRTCQTQIVKKQHSLQRNYSSGLCSHSISSSSLRLV